MIEENKVFHNMYSLSLITIVIDMCVKVQRTTLSINNHPVCNGLKDRQHRMAADLQYSRLSLRIDTGDVR